MGDTRYGADVRAGIFYDGRHHRRRGVRPYRYCVGDYFYRYRPIRYWRSYPDYMPYCGYTYTTVYYAEPYRYRLYDTDVYYVSQVYEDTGMQDVVASTEAIAAQPAQRPSEMYVALTEPGETTLIGEGNAAFAAGRYDEARSAYVRAVLADERDGYAKLLYAVANFALRDYGVAATALRRALLTTPELMDYPVDVRALYEDALVVEMQLEDLLRFVAEHPSDRGVRFLLGYLFYAIGSPEHAVPVLTDLAESDPKDTLAALLRDAVVRVVEERRSGS